MKLYYAPGACSVGIHVLLEEIGKPYEAQALNFAQGDQYKPEFISIKRAIPILMFDVPHSESAIGCVMSPRRAPPVDLIAII